MGRFDPKDIFINRYQFIKNRFAISARIPVENVIVDSYVDELTKELVMRLEIEMWGYSKVVEKEESKLEDVEIKGVLKMPKWLKWLKINVVCRSKALTKIYNTHKITTYCPYMEGGKDRMMTYAIYNGEPFMMSAARFEALTRLEEACKTGDHNSIMNASSYLQMLKARHEAKEHAQHKA